MGRSGSNASTNCKRSASSLAKALAPEEIRRGDFVAPLYVVSEWPSWYWDDDGGRSRDEAVRILTTPTGDVELLKVRGVCLPFVLVRTASGEARTLDVRMCRLARVDRRFAERSLRAARRARKRQGKLLRQLR